ncbi:MAG: signal peptidase II [Bryobacteraceae bacterium]|jgi:signal peptidase II
MSNARRRLAAFLTAVGVFAWDRWTKELVEARLGAYDTLVVIPGFFNIVNSRNPGVAFGIFQDNPSHTRTLLLIALSIAAILILGWMLWKIDRQDNLTATGLSLIFGGALGNVFDRAIHGTVTDFLDFYVGGYHWYTFNLADSAICVGAGLLIVSMLLSNRKQNAEA